MLAIALYTNYSILSLVLFLLVMLVSFRYRLIQQQKKKTILLNKWRPLLTRLLIDDEKVTEALPANETPVFLHEWNRMFGSIKGENLQRLIRLAYQLELQCFSLNMMKKHSIQKKLLAVITLGHMRSREAWQELSGLVTHHNIILSLSAARSLVWIDPARAIDLLMPVIMKRDDWPWSNVAYLLKQAPPSIVCTKLAEVTLECPVEKQPGFLRFMETCNCRQLTDIFADLLKNTDDDRVASTCLHITTDPRALPEVRKYTYSPRWHVRMHAATALGRLGNQEDRQRLEELTSDSEWWVRYRSAQALLALPGMTIQDLESIRDSSMDRFSTDIINQVIAEAALT